MYNISVNDQSILLLFSPIFLSGSSFLSDLLHVLKILLEDSVSCSKLSYKPLSALNLKINTLVSLLGKLCQAPFCIQAKYKRVSVEMECLCVVWQDFCCLTNCQCRRLPFRGNAVFQECTSGTMKHFSVYQPTKTTVLNGLQQFRKNWTPTGSARHGTDHFTTGKLLWKCSNSKTRNLKISIFRVIIQKSQSS